MGWIQDFSHRLGSPMYRGKSMRTISTTHLVHQRFGGKPNDRRNHSEKVLNPPQGKSLKLLPTVPSFRCSCHNTAEICREAMKERIERHLPNPLFLHGRCLTREASLSHFFATISNFLTNVEGLPSASQFTNQAGRFPPGLKWWTLEFWVE